MGGGAKAESTSIPVKTVFGRKSTQRRLNEARLVGQQERDTPLSQQLETFARQPDPFLAQFQQTLLQPQAFELDPLNQALAESAISRFGGNTALRTAGLGAPTQQQIIQQSLPFFALQRQQNLGNLLAGIGGRGQVFNRLLGAQEARLGRSQQLINALLGLSQIGRPQVGGASSERGPGFGAQLAGGFGKGVGTAFGTGLGGIPFGSKKAVTKGTTG